MLSEWQQFESRMSGHATRRKPVRVADALVAMRRSTMRCSRSMSRSWWSNLPAKGKSLAVDRVVVARVVPRGCGERQSVRVVPLLCLNSGSASAGSFTRVARQRFRSNRGSRPEPTATMHERSRDGWPTTAVISSEMMQARSRILDRDSRPPLRRGSFITNCPVNPVLITGATSGIGGYLHLKI